MSPKERRAIAKRQELDAIAAAMRAACRPQKPPKPTALELRAAAKADRLAAEEAEESRRIAPRRMPWPEPEPSFARSFPHFVAEMRWISKLTAAHPTAPKPAR